MSVAATTARQRTHEEKLDQLAEVAVRVGLGLKAGQELVMTASPDALPLARRITEQAYRAGASLVTTLYSDDEAALMRYHFAADESFDHAANWLYDGMGAAFKSGAARLAIAGGNPALLSNEDPGKVGTGESRCFAGVPARAGVDYAARDQLDDCGKRDSRMGRGDVPRRSAGRGAGQAVGGDLRRPRASMATIRLRAWKAHDADLQRRAALLNEKRYAALKYRGPGTDFRLGLADDHLWHGRRHDRGQRALLHSQYAHGRSVHHAAQRPRGRHGYGHQAAFASGHDDRRHPGAL